MTTILVVAAHPDDELLGCGGSIARHVSDGDEVHILILGEGARARDRLASTGDAEVVRLRESARRAASQLGAQEPRFAGFPDNRMDGVDLLDVIKVVEATVEEVAPRVVYTHHGGDLNVDHVLTHRAVLTACRPVPPAPVRAIYSFETLSSTEWGPVDLSAGFHPTRFQDITGHLEAKLKALQSYESEMREFPHPRSPEAISALARYRGATVGLEAAEAFQVIRDVV